MNIYEPAGRAREYSPLALNFAKGCTHGCKYCYVPNMLKRFNSNYNHDIPSLNPDLTKLKNSAKKMQGVNKQILLCFTTDPYSNENYRLMPEILNILNYYKHKVAILSKAGIRLLDDLENFRKFDNRIKIGATLTFWEEKDSEKWEPNAAMPKERIEVLKILAENGIKTWASFEPVIKPDQSLKLLQSVIPFIDHVKIGKINNYKGVDKEIDWADFLFQSVRMLRSAGMYDRFYIKNDLVKYNNSVYLSGNETNEDYLNL